MTDHLPRRQAPTNIGIPLNDLATNAVIDAVASVMPPNRLRNPREGGYDDFVAAAEHNDREARPAAAETVARLDAHLEQSGLVYFDRCFLANPRNAAIHTAYQTARSQHSEDLDAALVRAWTVRRRDWMVRAAIRGQVQPDDGEVAADVTDDRARRLAGLKAKIKSFMMRLKNAR